MDFVGEVTLIAPSATKSEDGLGLNVLRVITRIDNKARLLKPGMSGKGKVYAGKLRLSDIVDREHLSGAQNRPAVIRVSP